VTLAGPINVQLSGQGSARCAESKFHPSFNLYMSDAATAAQSTNLTLDFCSLISVL
jgi:hypothetical protein